MKLTSVDDAMHTYWFPAEAKPLVEVTVAVSWSPYGGDLYWVVRPFAPYKPVISGIQPVQYPGRTHAETKRQAERIARELFTTSVECLKLDHHECHGYLGNREMWPDAPPCPCDCHQGARR